MAVLEFDKTGERLIETGVSKCVYFPMNTGGTYGKGVAWNGIISVNEQPGGAEAQDLYADDIKYASLRSAETFAATVEAYTYPDEFAESDGSAEPVPGMKIGQQKRRAFGMAYVTQVGSDTEPVGGDWYKIHIIYNATVSPSEQNHQTINESPEAQTMSWEMTTTPVAVGGNYKPTAKLTFDSKKLGSEKIKLVEDMLYGTESTESTLKTPAEIITMLGGSLSA